MIKDFKNFDILSNVLVTIPHGGIFLPKEISKDSLSKYQEKLADECIDWFTGDLYDFRKIMNNKQVLNPISNVFLNVNRNPNDIDDCVPLYYEKIPIYKKDQELDNETKKLLISKYHLSFHQKIIDTKKLFILDGHSTKTGLKDLSGRQMKKDIIVANWQNSKLDPKGGTYTCPDMYIDCYLNELDKRLLHHNIERIMKEEIEKNTEYDTTYGHIQATYGLNEYKANGNRAPLIFQETNEDLYVTDGKEDFDKINELNGIFAESLIATITKIKKYLI